MSEKAPFSLKHFDLSFTTLASNQNIYVHDYGFIVLADGGIDPIVDIVFIHGFEGHPRTTWEGRLTKESIPISSPAATKPQGFLYSLPSLLWGNNSRSTTTLPDPDPDSKASKVFWPAELLPQDFPHARILTYGYDASVTRPLFSIAPYDTSSLFKLANDFLARLGRERLDAPDRPLIFIAHDLGGLILKDALALAYRETDSKPSDIYKSLLSIIFLGVPHRGTTDTNFSSELATIARRIKGGSWLNFNTQRLRCLKCTDGYAGWIHREFMELVHKKCSPVFTMQEGCMPAWGSSKIVDDRSSSLDYNLEKREHVRATHGDMTKYGNVEDDGYRAIKSALKLSLEVKGLEKMGILHLRNLDEQLGCEKEVG